LIIPVAAACQLNITESVGVKLRVFQLSATQRNVTRRKSFYATKVLRTFLRNRRRRNGAYGFL